MSRYLSGKQRVWAALGLAWLAFWFVFAAQDDEPLIPFFIFGVCPLLVVLAVIWIRRGFKQDQMLSDLQRHLLEEELTDSFRKSIAQNLSKERAIEIAQPIIDKLRTLQSRTP